MVSNTLDARFCTDALIETLERYGCPEIFNIDQGSQFTGQEFTSVLSDSGVAISMDGRGRCMDNDKVNRLQVLFGTESRRMKRVSCAD